MALKLFLELKPRDVGRAYPVLDVLRVGRLPSNCLCDENSFEPFAGGIYSRGNARRPASDNRQIKHPSSLLDFRPAEKRRHHTPLIFLFFFFWRRLRLLGIFFSRCRVDLADRCFVFLSLA